MASGVPPRVTADVRNGSIAIARPKQVVRPCPECIQEQTCGAPAEYSAFDFRGVNEAGLSIDVLTRSQLNFLIWPARDPARDWPPRRFSRGEAVGTIVQSKFPALACACSRAIRSRPP